MDQLINYGQVQRGSLGIAVTDLSPALAKELNVNLTSGAVITEVFAASHAAEAGLTAGDIITHVNQIAMRNMRDVRNKIGNLRVGTRVELTIVRNGSSQNVTTIIGRPTHQVQQGNFYRR
jgi:S1-C subfamily serine protease